MKHNILTIGIALALASGFASCSDKADEPGAGDSRTLSISSVEMASDSRAAIMDSRFSKGDEIGLFVSNGGSKFSDAGTNVRAVYDGSKWVLDHEVTFPAGTNFSNIWVNAYYPYKDQYSAFLNEAGISFRSADYSDDVMVSDMGWVAENGAVKLSFRHCLARLVFTVNATENYKGECNVDRFLISSANDELANILYSSCGFGESSFFSDDLYWNVVGTNQTDHIQLNGSWKPANYDFYEYLIYINDNSKDIVIEMTVDGKFYEVFSGTAIYVSGRSYYYNITLDADPVTGEINVTVSNKASILDWTEQDPIDYTV